MGIILEKDNLFVSYVYLKANGVSNNTLKAWQKRGITTRIERGIDYFILYDSIPSPTRSKLPSKDSIISLYKVTQLDSRADEYYRFLNAAYTNNFIKFVSIYKEKYNLENETAIPFAKSHAVWLWIYDEYIDRNLVALYTAYCKIYPERYTSKFSFMNALKKIKKAYPTIETIVFDNRILNSPKNVKKISDDNKYWVMEITKMPKKYGAHDIYRKIISMNEECGKKAPSLSWVKKYHKEIKRNYKVAESRYGKSYTKGHIDPYMTLIHSEYVNGQFQIDGWTVPFYAGLFKRFVLVVVIDAKTKKIVGYSIAIEEDTLSIMDAIRDAVVNTGCLPREFVMDNHSFQRTKEASSLKEATEKFGVSWTITSNPQHKSIVERYFQYLDKLCKNHFGYVGEGAKSKRETAHPTPELMREVSKKQYTHDEVKVIIIDVIKTYNNSILEQYGSSPNAMYESSEKADCITLDVYERARVLTARTELTMSRGQINITRGGIKYEFVANADIYTQYNNTAVAVHYEDLNDCIYIYDKKTEKPIGIMNRKPTPHGAVNDQTEDDLKEFNKHSGKIKGIKNNATKELHKIIEDGLKANPEAIEILGKQYIPKDLAAKAESDMHIKNRASELGIDTNKLPVRGNSMNELKVIDDDTPRKTKDRPFQKQGTMKRFKVGEDVPPDELE